MSTRRVWPTQPALKNGVIHHRRITAYEFTYSMMLKGIGKKLISKYLPFLIGLILSIIGLIVFEGYYSLIPKEASLVAQLFALFLLKIPVFFELFLVGVSVGYFFRAALYDKYKDISGSFHFILALFLGATGSLVLTVFTILSIFESSSSTAAIGLIFIPFWALFFFVIFAVLGLIYALSIRGIIYKKYRRNRFSLVLSALIAISLSVTCIYYIFVISNTYIAVKNIDDCSNTQMITKQYLNITKPVLLNYDLFQYAAIANNPHTSREVLLAMIKKEDPRFNKRIYSIFYPLNGNNTRGISVLRLIAFNPNTDKEILTLLSKSHDDYLLGDIAGNHKTPTAILIDLAKKQGEDTYLIHWGLARNPNTPSMILAKLAKSDSRYDTYMLEDIAANSNTPPAALKELAQKNNLAIDKKLSSNPNTPIGVLERLEEKNNHDINNGLSKNPTWIRHQH
jgi:hypothetical protein